ncbi:MAG: ribosome biogenesis GTP-binding protein YihA/YsxC [Candidatus Uhrbacteria bacterium]
MSATFIKCLTNIKDLPIGNKPHVAIVGRSNVGKSSLINHLVMQKGLARVGASPGRTQTINLFEIDKRYFLVDLPGYGFAKMSKDKRSGFIDMISHYLDRAPDLKLVLLIVDASIPPTDLDHEMLVFLQASGLPTVVVLNKIDKLSKNQAITLTKKFQADFSDNKCITHSTFTSKGRGEIWEVIDQAVRKE